MNAGPGGRFQSLPGSLNVLTPAASERGYSRPAYLARHHSYRLEVAVGRDRESRLNDVDPQALKLLRHAQLLGGIHAAARRLLPITQGGVEYLYVFSFGPVAPLSSAQSIVENQRAIILGWMMAL